MVPTIVRAATTWPAVENVVWNFTLEALITTTSTNDSLTISLDASDRLVFPDMVRILLFAGDQEEPLFARDWRGIEGGLNGLWIMRDDWHVPFAGMTGRLEMQMLSGSIALRRVTLIVEDGTRRYVAWIAPEVILTSIPEPCTSSCLAGATGILLFRRNRKKPV